MQRVPMNDLSRALTRDHAEILRSVSGVLSSGWLVQGPEHNAFESELGELLGGPEVIGVASGTDALEIAMRAAMPAGRSVVVTAANCGGYATTAARRAGFTIRYADVDVDTHCLDPRHLDSVLDDQVGIVVVTHLYGRAADVRDVQAVCASHGALVLEDCAQAIGAATADGPVGGLADVASFSFYPTKNLGALGDGGAVAARDPAIAAAARALRQYGWTSKYTIGHDGGRNSRLDELQAAVLRLRLHGLEAGNHRRREIIAAYAASATASVRVLPAEGTGHVGHLAVVVSDRRDQLRQHLDAHGVGSDVHYPVPDHRQPAFAAEYADVSLPVTERLAGQILSVPIFPELRDDEIQQVCDALASF